MILQSLAGQPHEVQRQLLDGVIHTFPESAKQTIQDIFFQITDADIRVTFLNLLATFTQFLNTFDPEKLPYAPLFEILYLFINRVPEIAPRWLAFLRFEELAPIPQIVWEHLYADFYMQIAAGSDHRILLCLAQLQNMLFQIDLKLSLVDSNSLTTPSSDHLQGSPTLSLFSSLRGRCRS